MPRPRKNGLDYFPLDVDFLDDPKIKILKARYGRDGIVFYIYLLSNCRWIPMSEQYKNKQSNCKKILPKPYREGE